MGVPLLANFNQIPNAAGSTAGVRLALNSDGSLLFDCYGNVWQTSTMQIYDTVALSSWTACCILTLIRRLRGM